MPTRSAPQRQPVEPPLLPAGEAVRPQGVEPGRPGLPPASGAMELVEAFMEGWGDAPPRETPPSLSTSLDGLPPIRWAMPTHTELEEEVRTEEGLKELLHPWATGFDCIKPEAIRTMAKTIPELGRPEEVDLAKASFRGGWENYGALKAHTEQIHKDPDSMVAAIREGRALPMPVAVRRGDGTIEVLGGATRSGIAKLTDGRATMLVIDEKQAHDRLANLIETEVREGANGSEAKEVFTAVRSYLLEDGPKPAYADKVQAFEAFSMGMSLARAAKLRGVDTSGKVRRFEAEAKGDVFGAQRPQTVPKETSPAPVVGSPGTATKGRRENLRTAGGEFNEDDPSSPNYRFRDTGYVFGSRKEMAALMIRTAAREGRQVRAEQIEWSEIERNPREAKALITKSNLFGTVDWEKLRGEGMAPGAGFLVDRIYAAIGKEPSEDSPRARQDYAIGLQTLRDRLEACKTPDEVTKAIDALREEMDGYTLNGPEQAAYDVAKGKYDEVSNRYASYRDGLCKRETALNTVQAEVSQLEWDQSKRGRRKWQRDPEMDARIQALRPLLETLKADVAVWENTHPDMQETWINSEIGGSFISQRVSTVLSEMREHRTALEAIKKAAATRNLVENPLCRAWALMGERFLKVLLYRSHNGSDAFQNHVATAKAGKIKDWEWADKEITRVAPSTKESVRFQLQVADQYERVGGRDIQIESSVGLKEAFGLREAEYGLWVAQDFNSAKFHTERCAAGFADLADLVGIEEQEIGLRGDLSMGFGSRGQGALGWRTSAPAATYYPQERVLNLTKMAGGGTLGHEWSHGLDNILPELATGRPSGVHDFASENPEILPEGPLRAAMKNLVKAMMEGPHRHDVEIEYTGRDYLVARQNVGRRHVEPAKLIREASDVGAAVIALKQHFDAMRRDSSGNMTRAVKSNLKGWTTIAAAHFGGEPEGGKILVKAGAPTSRYAYEAVNLDHGSKTPYWSTRRELFARAFQSWIEDRLAGQGRQNDYLSWHADNKYYVDPLFGPMYPYPEGEERARINKAFDEFFEAVRQSGVLKAKE